MDAPVDYLPLSLLMLGAFAGAGIWFVLFLPGLIQNVTIALPLMSFLGGVAGFLVGSKLERDYPVAPFSKMLANNLPQAFVLLFVCLQVLFGVTTRSMPTVVSGGFWIVFLISVPAMRDRPKMASFMLIIACALATTRFALKHDLLWLGAIVMCGLAAISGNHLQRNPDKLAKLRWP
jgi:hypothetical protein